MWRITSISLKSPFSFFRRRGRGLVLGCDHKGNRGYGKVGWILSQEIAGAAVEDDDSGILGAAFAFGDFTGGHPELVFRIKHHIADISLRSEEGDELRRDLAGDKVTQ